jgi:hypothetical protein
MNNLLNVQKFSVNNTRQDFNKNECKLKETKYNWFISIVVKVSNKIAQIFGAKTITQHNLSNSIRHAEKYLYQHKLEVEDARELNSIISKIRVAFSPYLRSDKGADDLELLNRLEVIIDLKIDSIMLHRHNHIDYNEIISETSLNRGWFLDISHQV